MPRSRIGVYLGAIVILAAIVGYWYFSAFSRAPVKDTFDGTRAWNDVRMQVDMGPRIPGSSGHGQILIWMQNELEAAGWQVTVEQTTSMGHPIQNLIAFRSSVPAAILLGAHYDTRIFASRDPDPSRRVSGRGCSSRSTRIGPVLPPGTSTGTISLMK